MSDKEDGGPAFPALWSHGDPRPNLGMTLRDYFAAKSLPLAWRMKSEHGWSLGEIAGIAYAVADAMLKERDK